MQSFHFFLLFLFVCHRRLKPLVAPVTNPLLPLSPRAFVFPSGTRTGLGNLGHPELTLSMDFKDYNHIHHNGARQPTGHYKGW